MAKIHKQTKRFSYEFEKNEDIKHIIFYFDYMYSQLSNNIIEKYKKSDNKKIIFKIYKKDNKLFGILNKFILLPKPINNIINQYVSREIKIKINVSNITLVLELLVVVGGNNYTFYFRKYNNLYELFKRGHHEYMSINNCSYINELYNVINIFNFYNKKISNADKCYFKYNKKKLECTTCKVKIGIYDKKLLNDIMYSFCEFIYHLEYYEKNMK
jgi:hypothetical protein